MKLKSLPTAAALFISAAFALHAEQPVMRDVATHDQLARAMKQSQQGDPMKSLPASNAPDASLNLPKDLVSQSDFISLAGASTLVPKHAILKVPAGFADRIRFQEGSRILSWTEFFAANRNWITTIEITPEQAGGKAPLPKESSDVIAKSSNLVVATFRGGPISLLTPKAPAETASIKP
ncbi:MAG: hypothetical protein CFE26_17165 [Verrucomicrobiales bacterium VVV1]|nr:MAG: hypothetical protein CFE26_17165 [Verrucomicrobiales bacterium VVV1]